MASELIYGNAYYLQNGYNGWTGGYLDTNGHATASGAKYNVSTNAAPDRDGSGTGTWQVVSVTGKAAGQPVLSGDLIYLFNLYLGDGGYLDSNGYANAGQQSAGGLYNVLTSVAKDRAPGTGRWSIFAQSSAPTDKKIRTGDVILLRNNYLENGGFLETDGTSSAGAGALYSVCTNVYYNRADNVGLWKPLDI